jgi:HK97 family phage portal protein
MSIAEKINQVRQGRKGISYHPELEHRVHVLRQGAGEEVNTELESFIDYATIYGCYVWVHKAVSKIAEAIAPLQVRVEDADGQVLDKHPLTELFLHVNDSQGPVQLWGAWVVHMLLGGEEFQEIVPDSRGNPVELWSRRPDKMAVVPDVGRPLYPAVAGYVFNHEDKYESMDVIHDRFYNPLSQWRGLAPIAAVRSGITIDMFAQAWSQSFLKKGARPDYALIAPDGMTSSERQEYESLLSDKHSGPDKWHRPIILEKGITDIKPFSWAPKDIEWLEQRKFSRDEVGGLFGVPDEVMGFGRDTYENMEAAHKWFWLLTLSSLIQHRDTTLTSFFTKARPILKPGERIATDLSNIGAMQEDLLPKLELAERLWKMGTPLNMLDERFGLGIGPIPGGDVGYLPAMVAPVGTPRFAPLEELTLLEGTAKALPMTRQASVTVPEYGSPRHKALWKASVARFLPYERRMKTKLLEDMEKVKAETLAALKATWAEGEKKPGQPI